MEQRIYEMGNCTEEVKRLVIGIEKLRCVVAVPPNKVTWMADLEKIAMDESKHCLMEGIEKFIYTEICGSFIDKRAVSTLFLPYVKDSIMERLKKENEDLASQKRKLDNYINFLTEEVRRLETPWYKKILIKLKR